MIVEFYMFCAWCALNDTCHSLDPL
jgi:hypothetical protein